MIEIADEQFNAYVAEAIESVPSPYKEKIGNIAFLVADEPSDAQRRQLGLRPCQSLFGLYEGVPLPKRGGNNGNLLPDVITLFKIPHEQHAQSVDELKKQIQKTVWHEIAHYFGLDHKRIHELENS